MYRAGRAWRGKEVEVCIVAEAVQMNYQGRIVRTQPIRHDRTKEHGAYATDGQRVGGEAHAELVARWLDDGLTPNGAYGRAFGKHRCARLRPDICAPKSVSLVRVLRTDDVVAKAVADAHTTALAEAMEFLAAHAGYTLTSSSRPSATKAPSGPHGL
jgi:hypothetical protein